MITASKGHAVKTRMESINKAKAEGKSIDLKAIFANVSGNSKGVETPALKYGRAMEPEAIATFLSAFEVNHTDVSSTQCGIFLCKDKPFIGGSPDLIVECKCCGKYCIEVKCPFSIRDKSPLDPASILALPYLTNSSDNGTSLKRSHKYFTQCQMQMGVTEINKSIFIIWTPHGIFQEEINFDNSLWESLKESLRDFYVNYYVPSLFQLDSDAV